MTTYTTVCPHCSASFFINKEQLDQRGGKARCGQCSQIFQADEYLVDDNQSEHQQVHQTNAPVTNPSYANMMAVQKGSTGSESELINDDMFKDSYQESKSDDIDSLNDFSDVIGTDISDDFKETLANMPAVNLSDPFSNIDTTTEVESVSDEAWLESLLNEEDVEQEKTKKTKKEESEDLAGFLSDIGANTAQFSTAPIRAASEKPTSLPLIKDEGSKYEGISLGSIVSSIIWLALSLAMIGLLAGQYLYFNFDALSRSTEGREQLSKACNIVKCEVPDISADSISFSEEKIVSKDGTNVLEFMVNNDSDKTTLLPAIKVSLYKKDKEVGASIVLPQQYLTGAHKHLPAIRPIRAKLKINVDKSTFNEVKLEALY